jgi:hypothetical protein
MHVAQASHAGHASGRGRVQSRRAAHPLLCAGLRRKPPACPNPPTRSAPLQRHPPPHRPPPTSVAMSSSTLSASASLPKRMPQLTSAPTPLRLPGGSTARSSRPCAWLHRFAPTALPSRLTSCSRELAHNWRTCAAAAGAAGAVASSGRQGCHGAERALCCTQPAPPPLPPRGCAGAPPAAAHRGDAQLRQLGPQRPAHAGQRLHRQVPQEGQGLGGAHAVLPVRLAVRGGQPRQQHVGADARAGGALGHLRHGRARARAGAGVGVWGAWLAGWCPSRQAGCREERSWHAALGQLRRGCSGPGSTPSPQPAALPPPARPEPHTCLISARMAAASCSGSPQPLMSSSASSHDSGCTQRV